VVILVAYLHRGLRIRVIDLVIVGQEVTGIALFIVMPEQVTVAMVL
jgi:hypothetical protein